jgi:hypothetical protein
LGQRQFELEHSAFIRLLQQADFACMQLQWLLRLTSTLPLTGVCRMALSSKLVRTRWPTLWQPIQNAVLTQSDASFGMDRTAVQCRRCGGHLGHVFDDGPKPTGLRYCMNGVAMNFRTSQG